MKMPIAVYLLGITIFSITTAEFMVAGMMLSLSEAFNVSIADVGHLISLYALGMVFGGPVLTAMLLKAGVPNKRALLSLLAAYACAQALASSASSYEMLSVARVLTGIAGSACFGVSLAICADIVPSEQRGRAASIVVAGLMLATVFGVPIATVVDQNYGWRTAFWLVCVMTVVCLIVVAMLVPSATSAAKVSLGKEFESFKNPQLWAAYTTSALVIGSTFAAFSYFAPILTQEAGFSASTIPWLLAVYGLANVVGNSVVGRFADRSYMKIMLYGLALLAVAQVTLWLSGASTAFVIASLIAIGLFGVPLNPAMIARVMKVSSHPGPLVNTVHTSVINIGLAAGSWLGGIGIARGLGYYSALGVGIGLAVIGIASLLPYHRQIWSKPAVARP